MKAVRFISGFPKFLIKSWKKISSSQDIMPGKKGTNPLNGNPEINLTAFIFLLVPVDV